MLLVLFQFVGAFAQDFEYSVFSIPEELKLNANSVVRKAHTEINIISQQSMTISTSKVVTILNAAGYENLQTTFYYDKYSKVKSIEGAIYNAYGTKLSRIKKGSFRDLSVNDDYPAFKGHGRLELKYTPVEYPFTIEMECTIESSNTADIPTWFLIEHYNESIESGSLLFNGNLDLGFKWFEVNFSDKYTIEKKSDDKGTIYLANKVPAVVPELAAPHLTQLVPHIIFTVERFSLEGEQGEASNFKELGDWYIRSFLQGAARLSNDTENNILKVMDTVKSSLEKAKSVYQYVQKHTRCVNVPLGLGGWRPMDAKEVAKLGYGDSKSLVNYTKALLDFVEVPSYYTLVYADEQGKRDVKEDIVRLQGNHVILQVPIKGKNHWLECSSFVSPFGLQCEHTDGRNALVLKPESSQIIKTGAFSTAQNKRVTTGRFAITEEGDIAGEIKVVSTGAEYERNYFLERRSKPKQFKYYVKRYANLNGLSIDTTIVANNRSVFEFTEAIKFEAKRFGKRVDNDLTFSLNAFSQQPLIYLKNKDRQYPIEILQGMTYVDEIQIDLPDGFVLGGELSGYHVETKYGRYKTEIQSISEQSVIYKREFVLNKGFYHKEEYEDFRLFMEQVTRNDVSKVELVERKK